MAGTIPLSMTQQFDVFGKPLAGGQLYIIQAGTVSTPQDAFQDTALTIKLPYPIPLDAAGRIPQFFLADGSVKIRLQDRSGVVQLGSDSVLVIGPSAGGGGGSTVDPTQLITTGNMILRYGFGSITGYVRPNNLTIGSATSGATERANADTQALFNFLWGIDPNLVIVGGRGATALADWTANKQLTLPDWRGYAIGCLDDMGNAPAGRLSAAYFGTSPIVLGAPGGGESVVQAVSQMPAHTPSGVITNGAISVAISPNNPANFGGANNNNGGGGGSFGVTIAALFQTASASQAASFFTGNSIGGGQPFRTIGPRKLLTAYIKL